jgi:hypothetical protein
MHHPSASAERLAGLNQNIVKAPCFRCSNDSLLLHSLHAQGLALGADDFVRLPGRRYYKPATRADSFAGRCYLFIDLAMRDQTQDATHAGSPVPAYKARKVFGLNISKEPVSRME